MSIGFLVMIQKEAARLMNAQSSRDDWTLDKLIGFINNLSPYECVPKPGGQTMIVRNKKTLKEVDV